MKIIKKIIVVLVCMIHSIKISAVEPIHNSIYNTPSSSNAIYNGYNLFTENEQFPETFNGNDDDLDVEIDDLDHNDDQNEEIIEKDENPRHNSLLEIAIINNDLAGAKNIIDEGRIDCNYQNKDGRTALHFAAAQDAIQIVLLLLQHGADIAIQDFQGWTPLHAAVDANAFTVATTLLDNKADCTIKTFEDETPQDLVKNDIMKAMLQEKCV